MIRLVDFVLLARPCCYVQGAVQSMVDIPYMMIPFPQFLRLLSVLALLMGVFWIDLSMPLGIAVPVLYVIPVSWIAFWSGRRETLALIVTGLFATVLIVLRYGLAAAGESDLAVINRLLPSSVIWATILFALFRKVQEEDRRMREALSQVLQKLTNRPWRR
jgi:ABC-type proline/glycine betaine transport system permease subunit